VDTWRCPAAPCARTPCWLRCEIRSPLVDSGRACSPESPQQGLLRILAGFGAPSPGRDRDALQPLARKRA
jgi:hypothetical protein